MHPLRSSPGIRLHSPADPENAGVFMRTETDEDLTRISPRRRRPGPRVGSSGLRLRFLTSRFFRRTDAESRGPTRAITRTIWRKG